MKPSFIKQKILIYGLLFLIVLLNLYLYRNEFIVTSDPNDNNFHYALVDEAKNIWKDVFSGKTSILAVFDSWNERWAEGFPLSLYYSHLPQASIALLSFIVPISTFKLFVIIRTLLLVLLPVSFFFGAQILGLSSLASLIVAFFSQSIFTDGLYGIDATNYLWRGWGLSAQLLAVFFLPYAFAYSLDYLENKKNLGKAIIFNFIVAQSHFGMLYLLMMVYPVYWFFSKDNWIKVGKRALLLIALIMISLSYFIIPFFTTSFYRNFSYWDPIWKFNSWGMMYIITLFTNGDLFDFNRLPFITFFVICGLLWSLMSKNKLSKFLVTMFIIYFVLFLGKEILGPLVNIIPGLSEYHLHRVIVMVQFIGIIVAGDLLANFIKSISLKKGFNKLLISLLLLIISGVVVYQMEKPVIKYTVDNNSWIEASNKDYQENIGSYNKIIEALKKLPSARVYAGQPGNWGKNFKIGNNQMYMALSRDGFPTVGFLPQSWSPNSDPEQFFNENNTEHYKLYNIGYLVLPADKKAPDFAKLIIKEGRFSLYKMPNDGWFGLGKTGFEVKAKKTDLLNIIHLWFNSSLLKNKNYPIIKVNGQQQNIVKNTIIMDDLNHYDNGKDIWQTNPLLETDNTKVPAIKKEEEKLVKGYQIKFELEQNCPNCILILRQTFHPNWDITVNDKKVDAIPVFPFFIGIPLNGQGNYAIKAVYQPMVFKTILLFLSIFFFVFVYKKIKNMV